MAIDLRNIKDNSKNPIKAKNEPQFLEGFQGILSKEISFKPVWGDKQKEKFYSELFVLLNSGIDMKTALELLTEQFEKQKEQQFISVLLKKVIDGQSLSMACKDNSLISPYEYFCIQIGEESGKLDHVISELSTYYHNKIKQRKQIIQTLTYPIIVLVTAMASIFFMLGFIVPMFKEVFARFGKELPWLTNCIIQFAEVMPMFLLVFSLVIGIAVFYVYKVRKLEWFRIKSSKIILATPILGNYYRVLFIFRFSRAMQLLLKTKTPLVIALELSEKVVEFYPIEKALREARLEIIKGSSLCNSLSKHLIFDKKFISLIKIGEEVNKLDQMFERYSFQMEEELKSRSALIGELVEPVLIILLGAVVTIILVSLYLPLFQMGSGIGV